MWIALERLYRTPELTYDGFVVEQEGLRENRVGQLREGGREGGMSISGELERCNRLMVKEEEDWEDKEGVMHMPDSED